MITQFKEFLTKSNALALAVGVIIGAATGKFVSSIVADLLMPLISFVLPAGDWRDAQLVLKRSVDAAGKESLTAIKYGDLAGTTLDFLIISFVVFYIAKAFIPKKADAPTKVCAACKETIVADATKCKFCGSSV